MTKDSLNLEPAVASSDEEGGISSENDEIESAMSEKLILANPDADANTKVQKNLVGQKQTDEEGNLCANEDSVGADLTRNSAVKGQRNSFRDEIGDGELDYDEDDDIEDAECEKQITNENDKKVAKKVTKDTKKAQKEEVCGGTGDDEKEEGEADEDDEEGEKPGSDHSTDGEIDDDEDCEDGEIKEPGQKKPYVRPICRFFMRGNCTWGISCRFLHPGVNDKGNYSMIEAPMFPVPMPPMPHGMMMPMMPHIRPPFPPMPPPAPWMYEMPHPMRPMHRPPVDIQQHAPVDHDATPSASASTESTTESAWERGLRHAKEIRKKQKKETDVPDEKKQVSDDDGRKSPASVAAPEQPSPSGPAAAARDADTPASAPAAAAVGADSEFVGGRPPEMWPYRPPYFDPRWGRWPPHPDFAPQPPPYFMPPPDFHMDRERGQRFTPPRPQRTIVSSMKRSSQQQLDFLYEPRREGRYNSWFDQGGSHPREPGPGPAGDMPPQGPRGRGEEWKDPWIRSRSPKHKHRSSSRSPSRGRRRYRTRSKGSFSSSSSNTYSSRSRSHSASSSSYSSYSRSSRSRSSFSSRSSSSRSRSRSGRRKRAPVAKTLGQTVLEKRKITTKESVRTSGSAASQFEPLAMGSGPLPARAPPEKKPPEPKSVAPPPSGPAIAVQEFKSAAEAAKAAMPTPVAKPVPPPSSQPVISKVGQLLPVAARPKLQPVGKGAAAAFTEPEEEASLPPPPKSTLTPLPPPASPTPLPVPPPVVVRRDSGAKVAAPVSPKSDKSSKERQKNVLGKPSGDNVTEILTAAGTKAKLMMAGVSSKSGRVTERSSGKPSRRPSYGSRRQSGSKGHNKLEIGRNVIGRSLSSSSTSESRSASKSRSRSRSSSQGSQRSLSSLSSNADSEHLYRDIASPISSASSPSPPNSPDNKPPPEKPRPVPPPVPVQKPPPPKPVDAAYRRSDSTQESLRPPASPGQDTSEEDDDDTSDDSSSPQRTPLQREDVVRGGARPVGARGMPRDAVPNTRREQQHQVAREKRREFMRGGPPREPGRERERAMKVLGHHKERRLSDSQAVARVPGMRGAEARLKPVPPPTRRSGSSQGAVENFPPRPVPPPHSMEMRKVTGSKTSTKSSSKVPSQAVPQVSRKRQIPHDELPSAKQMRHEIEVKSPAKIPVQRVEKSQKPPSASHISPSRAGGRASAGRAPVPSSVAPGRSPGKGVPRAAAKTGAAPAAAAVGGAKRKSTSSRREELLMQLKAVEDAIAKKRSKIQ